MMIIDEIYEIEIFQVIYKHNTIHLLLKYEMKQLIECSKNGLEADFIYQVKLFSKIIFGIDYEKFETETFRYISNQSEEGQFKSFKIYIILKRKLFQQSENMMNFAHKKIQERKAFLSYIQKFYYCGLIWFSVTGCKYQKVCGRLMNSSKKKQLLNNLLQLTRITGQPEAVVNQIQLRISQSMMKHSIQAELLVEKQMFGEIYPLSKNDMNDKLCKERVKAEKSFHKEQQIFIKMNFI
ncbi:unnamed protein product [Paramecium octaurelia]|uniref:Uncharacterized protein n=1 Tax=Paramecium octaurelia TaxID=43137 RepID=A0A8S1UEJ7_PAROT|nr:unnamed protein product [Paramecium octaurelia]CAD8163681.1 unnamed protein product [Paramecium octaurelia]